ncbi:MAG TPA: amino acid adenylation domain-containing protein, partial [Terrimicrobiaceae bacterium]
MDEINQRIAALPPAKRAVLEERLAKERNAKRDRGAEKSRAPLLRQPRSQRPPLSYGQQRIWFLNRLEGSTAEYILPQAMRLEGELDRHALERALQAMVDRHESLRTRFDEFDGEPFQVIEPDMRLPLPFEDLSDLDDQTREQATSEALSREFAESFDLNSGPLLRTKLFKLGERDHVLFLLFHHIISDGWSMSVFNDELGILYDAFCKGRENPLQSLPLQYPDYAMWQRNYLQGEGLERLLTYWRSQLADVPALELPNDRPRPARLVFDGESQSVDLPGPLCAKLRNLSNGEGATMAMLMLACFKLLLHRLAGQDDITVGTPVAGRNNVETEPLIGFFVNTLALRTNFCGNPTFRQLLGRVRKTALEAYAHQEAPFEKLIEVLNPERTLNRHPLFEVFFNYVNIFQMPSSRIPGLSVDPIQIGNGFAKFSMTLYVKDAPESINLRLVYQSSLFSPERIAHFLDQLEHLVAQVAENPDRPIQAYSLVTEKARHLLPDPTISISEPEQILVTSRFLSNAKLNPSHIAIRHEGREWTYRELAGSAQEIAALLMARGVQPGEVVAVSGQRSFGLISGIMGVLLARGVLLMLDSSLPSARRDLMLQAASSKHWLSINDTTGVNQDGSEAFRALPVTRISSEGVCVDAPGWTPEGTVPIATNPGDPAYVFFTSGTTGVPKGILGTHKGLSHFLQWEQETLGVAPNDRVAQLTGLSFDVVLRDIFLPLRAGATLCLPDTGSAPHGNEVVPWMRREHITILHTVPSLATAWLDGLESPTVLPELRWVLMAGEALTDTLIGRWRQQIGPACGICNLYGPTETTLAKCVYRVPEHPGSGIQPLGSPLPNTQAIVINKADELCGIAEPGEIVIRTPFRTLGYLNAAQEGRSGFIPNPFGCDPRDMVYRTGDCGSYNNEGLLLISGRLDDQVKIRGNRVEPMEVAAALTQYPEMRECAVVAREDGNGDKCLVAYVVGKLSRTDLSVVGLRDFLKQRLPDYMIPTAFVMLEKLPLTPNGKLDRKALPPPENICLQSPRGYLAPRDHTERILAKLWSNLLKLENVGVQDDFFELGGHSLIATRLVSQMRREFNVEIPLRVIFANTTIERLALHIAGKRAGSIASDEIEELLKDLESLPEDSAERRVIEIEERGRNPLPATEKETNQSVTSSFSCPSTRSKFFGARQCNLLIVINERFQRRSFEELADYVREFDPKITALVTSDRAPMDLSLPRNPTLIFSPALIRHR